MGEGEEMTKNDGGGQQQQGQQRGKILRLNTNPYCHRYTIDNQRFIDNSRSCLVHVLMEIKVDGTRQEKDHDKRIENEIPNIQLRVVVELEGDDLLTMQQEASKSIRQHCDASIEPIGHHHRQDGGEEATEGEGTEIAQNDPVNRNKPQQFREYQRGS